METAAVLAVLLLGDGRFPAGGHVHSAGIEAAVADRRVVDDRSLEAFVTGRLRTVGLVEAALAAATALRLAEGDDHDRGLLLRRLDAEANARITVTSLRDASRKQGRQLTRVGGRCWPSTVLAELVGAAPGGAHLPVALGAVGAAAGLDHRTVATLAVHHAVTTPAQAAVRLLGLDPFTVAALTVRVGEVGDAVVDAAVRASAGRLADLPAASAPLVDIAATRHARSSSRLFAT